MLIVIICQVVLGSCQGLKMKLRTTTAAMAVLMLLLPCLQPSAAVATTTESNMAVASTSNDNMDYRRHAKNNNDKVVQHPATTTTTITTEIKDVSPSSSTSRQQVTSTEPNRHPVPHHHQATSTHHSLVQESIDASSYFRYPKMKQEKPIFPHNYSFDAQFVYHSQDIERVVEYGIEKYKERFHIPPPPHYDAWVRLALSHNVTIDPEQYDQVYIDFLRYRNPKNPEEKTIPRSRLEAALRSPSPNAQHLLTGEISNGAIRVQLKYSFDKGFNDAFAIGKHLLPEKMLFLVTDLDEPVSIDRDAEGLPDDIPLPAEVFRHNKCLRDSFLTYNDASKDPVPLGQWHPFFKIYSKAFHKPPFEMNQLPILSRCKLDCFNDIVVPYYDYLFNSLDPTKVRKPWDERNNQIIFRGKNSGSFVDSTKQWRNSPRIRLVEWARSLNLTNPPYGIDVALSEAVNCLDKTECEELQKYLGNRIKMADVINSKYVLILDGNTWADRFDKQLSVGSLIFWSTIFTDWKYLKVKPFVHYIPVPMERSFDTLTKLLKWAHDHDDLAKRIAVKGTEFANQHFLRPNYLMYILLVLMEYGRLYDDTK